MENHEVKKRVLEQKVVGIVAESSPVSVVDAVRSSTGQAEVFKIRADCFEPQYLNEESIRYLRKELPNISLMISIRHLDSIPEERREIEGHKTTESHDFERIGLLRTAVQEVGMQYFELEHNRRKGFILFGGENAPKVVILYTNHKETPSLERLSEIRADIARVGSDHIIIETLVRNQKGDKGEQDREILFGFAKDNLKSDSYRPLAIVGRGKYGGKINLEAYQKGLSSFVYGVIPSFHPIPFLTAKKVHQEMPTLDEVNRYLGLRY